MNSSPNPSIESLFQHLLSHHCRQVKQVCFELGYNLKSLSETQSPHRLHKLHEICDHLKHVLSSKKELVEKRRLFAEELGSISPTKRMLSGYYKLCRRHRHQEQLKSANRDYKIRQQFEWKALQYTNRLKRNSLAPRYSIVEKIEETLMKSRQSGRSVSPRTRTSFYRNTPISLSNTAGSKDFRAEKNEEKIPYSIEEKIYQAKLEAERRSEGCDEEEEPLEADAGVQVIEMI